MTIELIDARSDSLTVTWPVVTGAKRYILELKAKGDAGFRELSSKLTQPQARKKNLVAGGAYTFRVTPVLGDETNGPWMSHREAFSTLSEEEGEASMEAPTISRSGNHALVVRWKPTATREEGYELQMRENSGGAGWKTIAASFSGTEVRKKNLVSEKGYQFRVRPAPVSTPAAAATAATASPFSPPSETMVALGGVSEALRRRWFSGLRGRGTLLKKGSPEPVSLEEALGGKEFVLFYVSAHWCPPCRRFTPMLAEWYRTHHKTAEVVFVSADHDSDQFENYFAESHPWLAIGYDTDSQARENLMATLRVQGIPRLVVVDAKSGHRGRQRRREAARHSAVAE